MTAQGMTAHCTYRRKAAASVIRPGYWHLQSKRAGLDAFSTHAVSSAPQIKTMSVHELPHRVLQQFDICPSKLPHELPLLEEHKRRHALDLSFLCGGWVLLGGSAVGGRGAA